MNPGPDNQFNTREEAESARDQRNQAPPEHGYGEWYLGGPVDGMWRVIRWRGLMADDVGDAAAYEHAYREASEQMAMNHDGWRKLEGIRFEAVKLEGTYPDTKLVLLFRSVPQEPFGNADPNCVFGIQWPVWPASDPDPAERASELEITVMEFLGSDPRGYRVRGDPCDHSQVNWLN